MAGKRFRPTIPDRVKLKVVLRQEGKDPGGEKLGNLADIEFDHCPPLGLREYDEATRTYTPDANDPSYIVARIKKLHRDKTSHPRGPHTSLGGDQHLIAKVTNPDRIAKFKVDKRPRERRLTPDRVSTPSGRCPRCGGPPGECTCKPREKRPAFSRKRA